MPVTMHQAKTHFSKLVAQVEQGEEIVIARGDKPVARLVPYDSPTKPKRVPGRLKGMFEVPPNFFDPLTDEELKVWHGDDE